jgi:L-iditol 2-dehydrogenase
LKSVVLVSNAKLEIQEVAEPTIAPDACLVSIDAAGVCSSDVQRGFDNGAYFYPLVMGHELAGTILETGAEVHGLEVGDVVTVFPLLPCQCCDSCNRGAYAQCHNYDYYGSRRYGGFTERLEVKAWNLLPVPEDVSVDDAALCEPTSVVAHALHRLGVQDLQAVSDTDEMVILGGGFLGLIAAKLCKMFQPDLLVTVLDRNEYKLEIASSFCVDTVLLREPEDWRAYVADNDARFSMVLEAAGVPATYEYALNLTARRGVAVWMGNISADLTLPAKLVSQVLRKEIDILGAWNSEYHGRAPSDWTAALDYMRQGLNPSDFVSLRVDLDGLPDALHRLHDHKTRAQEGHLLKVLVKPQANER